MPPKNFFKEMSLNSTKKSAIISETFQSWLKQYKNEPELYYIDLFSGPGTYENGEQSTPLHVMNDILKSAKIARKFNVVLNDRNKKYVQLLNEAVHLLNNIHELKSLTFSTRIVGKDSLQSTVNIPSFVVLDPWGYKGINRDIIKTFLMNPKNSVILLFSFNQLNRFICFKGIEKHLLNLFSKRHMQRLLKWLPASSNKENLMLRLFLNGFRFLGMHSQVFRFRFEDQTKTSHFLIFLNKSEFIMDKIRNTLQRYSSCRHGGCGSFCFSASCENPIVKVKQEKHCHFDDNIGLNISKKNPSSSKIMLYFRQFFANLIERLRYGFGY